MKFSVLALFAVATLSSALVSANPEEAPKSVSKSSSKGEARIRPIIQRKSIVRPKENEKKGDDYDEKPKRPVVKPANVKPYGGGYSEETNRNGYNDGRNGDGYSDYYDQYDNGYNAGRKSGYGEGYNIGSKDGFEKGTVNGNYKGERQGVATGWSDGVQDGVDKGYWSGYNEAERVSEKKGETSGFKQGFEFGEKTGYELGMKQGYGLAIAESGTGKYGDLIRNHKDDWKQYYKGGNYKFDDGFKGKFGGVSDGSGYTESRYGYNGKDLKAPIGI